jgi:hypothetical protein
MTLHVFNPEHDIALASGLSNFTAPHAARQLRYDLGFLPALWAAEDDLVLVDDVEHALKCYQRLARAVRRHHIPPLPVATPRFVSAGKRDGLSGETSLTAVDPWGWDTALSAKLRRGGVGACLLPTSEQLAAVRELSHRRTAARLLPLLRLPGTVGEAFECHDISAVEHLLTLYPRLVLKAPWSSSGRGLRFVDASTMQSPHAVQLRGWLTNILSTQGSVMAEPYYPKVCDFGMEFYSNADGTVSYCGLSLFHTANGAYTGNLLATEQAKRQSLSRYVSTDLLDAVQAEICRCLPGILAGSYCGPLGIDMMIVSPLPPLSPFYSFHLHPCVEINLRRTMGHVALALAPTDDDIRRVMRIHFVQNNYYLKIEQL